MAAVALDEALDLEQSNSIDAEIVRLAGVIAKSLADKIRTALKAELADVVPEIAVSGMPEETSAPQADIPGTEASSPAVAELSMEVGETAPPLTETKTLGAQWRDSALDMLGDVPQDALDNVQALGDLYQLATAAVDIGYGPDNADAYLQEADAKNPPLDAIGAADRLSLFRHAVAFETRVRKQEEKERRAQEATVRRLAKMEEKRQKRAQLMEKRRKEIEAVLPKAKPQATAPAPVQIKAVPKDLCKSLVVVGLLPAQADMIKREYKGAFEFAFFGNDHLGRMTNVLPHADAVVMMTDFISHSHCELFDGLAKVIRVPGGMSSLRKALHGFYQDSYPQLLAA